MTCRLAAVFAAVLLFAVSAFATIFGGARGVVHDAQHRPIAKANIILHSRTSQWSVALQTGSDGEFTARAVPLGEYSVTVTAAGFAAAAQDFTVTSGSEPVLHFLLTPAAAHETVTVESVPMLVATDSATTITLLNRQDVQLTPGASRSNSLALITDFVPGSYVTHDQLHIRGGHQTSWLIDGVPIPNTNIASNLGPQLDPKDMDYLEVQRGGYDATFGDRTYGVFNIVPRTGFERSREAELVLSGGNFSQTNDQLSFGSHTPRFAYYGSVNANRSDLGIQTPVPQVVHDRAYGYGGFTSLIYNLTPADQLRFVASLRRDDYQIPYDPFPNDIENADIAANGYAAQYPSIGLRDSDRETDALVNFSWVHTFNPRALLTASPFYHYNRANYEGSPLDTPVSTRQFRGSTYAGGQVTLDATLPKNRIQLGTYSFYQSDSEQFGAVFNDGSETPSFNDHESRQGAVASFFIEDKFTPAPWITISAGMRPTRFSGAFTETAISPRVGVAITVPKVRMTLRGFYGHYYQAPPLTTASGSLLAFAQSNGSTFVPLHGERDEEFQFGASLPYHGWVLDVDTFRTRIRNFFDHNNIGESNLFFPVTIQSALIRAWEVTLRTPRIAHRAQFHLAFSNQIAEGGGVVTGGLTDSGGPIQVCDDGVVLCVLDHDQRNTLNLGGEFFLPWHTTASTNVSYGSGFANAFPGQPYGGDHLPQHTTFDVSVSHAVGERCTLSVTALNVANRRVLLDNSVTFGGFHWNAPREVFAEVRYRFKY